MSNCSVCIIGAGVSGLTSARYLKEEGISFTVLEATQYIGGTWRYDPRVGTDENGQPIHTSMYKNLRINLAAPAMELKGFPLPRDTPAFPGREEYYEYILSYAKHFDLEQYIQYHQLVTSVKRMGDKWTVQHRDVLSGATSQGVYDYIIIATGHYKKSRLPDIAGEKKFKGRIIHSHDYREPEMFKDRRVLVIGTGPSGLDIGVEVGAVCKSLFHVHYPRCPIETPYPPHYTIKHGVKEFTEEEVVFIDNSVEPIDDVIYCTGYEYDFPFLDETSELTIRPKYVLPLHKTMININHPSMIFVGLFTFACNVIAIDAQARYMAALLSGKFTLPSKEQMMEELQQRINEIESRCGRLRDLHYLGKTEDQYYDGLTRESGIDRVPPVMARLRIYDFMKKLENYYTYRNYIYTIVDDHTFTRHLNPLFGSEEENKETVGDKM